ncbi:MAG: type II secretion system protein, partial [Patescibacteria group bacterium]
MGKILLKTYKGFTLIELLIVIAIIGILSVAFLPVLRGSTASARDAARVAAANDMLTAIEAAYADGKTIPLGTDTGDCIANFSTDTTGVAIRDFMGRAPKQYKDNAETVCSGGGFFYVTYKSTGVLTVAGETAT